MTGQLTFDLGAVARRTRADFFVSASNAQALAAVDGWVDWPGSKMVLAGPAGSGKTHLAHVWAVGAEAQVIGAQVLAGCDLPGLGARVVVEDADRMARDAGFESALFHLHNLILPAGRLLVTAASPPRDWGLALPDLISRLQAAPLTRLEPPDDALLSAVLIKLFADRQIAVPPNLIAYLVSRMDRSLAVAGELVAGLDAAGLARGRPVTRALAAELLDKA